MNVVNGSRGGGNTHSVKLPKLVIERFSRDVKCKAKFLEPVIHDNPNLSIPNKFNYSKSFLSAIAANVVAGLSLSAVNLRHCHHDVEDQIWSQGLGNHCTHERTA